MQRISLQKLRSTVSLPLFAKIMSSISVIADAFERYGGHLALSFNGGKDCTVLLYLIEIYRNWHSELPHISTHLRKIPQSIKSPSDEQFALSIALEIEREIPQNSNHSNTNVNHTNSSSNGTNHDRNNSKNSKFDYSVIYFKNEKDFEEMQSFMTDLCAKLCHSVSIISEPPKQGLQTIIDTMNVKAVFMGVRSSDPYAAHLTPFSQTDSNWPQTMRVLPILDFNYQDIWTFLKHLDLSYCSLYDKGYSSVGRVYNTSPNPNLKDEKGQYLPAYKLSQSDSERSGRETDK